MHVCPNNHCSLLKTTFEATPERRNNFVYKTNDMIVPKVALDFQGKQFCLLLSLAFLFILGHKENEPISSWNKSSSALLSEAFVSAKELFPFEKLGRKHGGVCIQSKTVLTVIIAMLHTMKTRIRRQDIP